MKGIYYKHKKGGIYEIISEGKHSETLENLIIYKSCDDDSVWVRPKKMFFDGRFEEIDMNKICNECWCTNCRGYQRWCDRCKECEYGSVKLSCTSECESFQF